MIASLALYHSGCGTGVLWCPSREVEGERRSGVRPDANIDAHRRSPRPPRIAVAVADDPRVHPQRVRCGCKPVRSNSDGHRELVEGFRAATAGTSAASPCNSPSTTREGSRSLIIASASRICPSTTGRGECAPTRWRPTRRRRESRR